MTEAKFSANAQLLHDHTHPKVRGGHPHDVPVAEHAVLARAAIVVQGVQTDLLFIFLVALLFLVPVQTGLPAPLIATDVNDIIQANADRIDAAIR